MKKMIMIIVSAAFAAIEAFADGTTLIWKGEDGASWTEGENWLNGETPSAWVDGANAVFPTAATVALDGAVTVANLTAEGALTVTGTVASAHSGFLNPNSPVLVFPGLTMDDIADAPIAADLNGNYMGTGIYLYSKAYFWRRSGTTATAQFQGAYKGHLRCVKATFTQGADGIYAQASANSYLVRSIHSGASFVGRDIDVLDHVEKYAVATVTDGNGIGICNIRRYVAEVNLTGTASSGTTYVKGAKVELKQAGADVTARFVESYYHQNGTLGEDLENTSGVTKYTKANGNGVKNMTLRLAAVPTVTFNAANEISYMTVDNASVIFKANGSQPRIDLLARNAAHVEYNAQETSVHADATRIFESGSSMVALYKQGTSDIAKYVFDDSTLYTPLRHESVFDGSNYFNYLTLRNGAAIPGNPLRCGFGEATCTIEGETGIELAAGIDLVKINKVGVTNDLFIVTKADFLISGNIYDWPKGGNYVGERICKRGAATLTLSGSNTFVGRLTVEEGTLALGSDDALPASAPLTLAGGTVTCGETVNATGSLTLSGSATINLGDGALFFSPIQAAKHGRQARR